MLTMLLLLLQTTPGGEPIACTDARRDAIEAVRAAWYPRPYTDEELEELDNILALPWTVSGCSGPWAQDTKSSRYHECMAEQAQRREKREADKRERERLARQALKAVDEACGVPEAE